MAHGKFLFLMPVRSDEAFEVFFNHGLRLRWDTLVNVSHVEGGGTHPFVGAITANKGSGWKRWFSMRTRYLTYEPPLKASAVLVEPTGIFAQWGASMRFHDRADGGSQIAYTFTIRLRPRLIGLLFDPIAGLLYGLETRLRFAAMARYLRCRKNQNHFLHR